MGCRRGAGCHQREDLVDDLRRQAFGGLVDQQQARRTTSTRAIASICCSPPDSVVPIWLAAFAQAREALCRSRRAGAGLRRGCGRGSA
jgi:hypothetical protein